MTYEDSLHAHLASFETAPLLFVGSGMSRRYLGADDWEGLLKRFAAHTGQPYERYRADADGDASVVASTIAVKFKDVWWDHPDFADSRREHTAPANSESPLKIEVAKHFLHSAQNLPHSGPLFEELNLLKNAVIEGAITTNYDLLLEEIFSGYQVYVGQDQLLFNNPQGVGEIYKIHGSADEPESIILTAKDYESFNKRNQYLAAKLLTLFVEHPIIFLGYSLSDPNIQEILRNIAAVLTTDNLHKLQDRLIFVQWQEEPVESDLVRTFLTVDGVPIPIHSVGVNDFMATFSAMARLKRRINPQILRRVKEQVYDLVSTSESQGSLLVRDIDDDVDPASVEIVIGVGIHQKLALQGLVGWQRASVLREVLEQSLASNQSALETVAREVLPPYLSGGTNTPVFYFLSGAGRLNVAGKLSNQARLDDRVKRRAIDGYKTLRPTVVSPRKLTEIMASYSTFEELSRGEDKSIALQVLPFIDVDKLDNAHLRAFLLQSYDETMPGKPTTLWARAVCLYDAVMFGPLRTS